MDLELLQQVFQFLAVISFVRQADHGRVEDLTVLFDALVRVAVRVDRNEQRLKIKVFELLAFFDRLNRRAHLLKRDGAHIRAERKPKVDEIVLAFKVFVRDRVALCVVK